MPAEFREILAQSTGGRRYSFAIMGFRDQYQFFKELQSVIAEATGYECKRADDLLNPAGDLRPKIHAAIDGAALIVAEISSLSPNVFYEIGYAVARGKPLIILARNDVKPPTDLAGVEIIRYDDTREGTYSWQAELRRCLAAQFEAAPSLLHALVLPEKPDRSYIVANPKLPDESSRFKYHPAETKTYGDYIGVAGIFGAFASFYGESFAPHLVSAIRASSELATTDANLYLIGSTKVNLFTGMFLDKLQRGGPCSWVLDVAPDPAGLPDPPCRLTGILRDGRPFCHTAMDGPDDYGLVIRGPHPAFPSRMIMILAGTQSLGTGSACLAATRTELIRAIRDKIGDDAAFTDRKRTVWALVKGTAGADGHIDPMGVRIIEAGVCAPAISSASA